MNTLDYYIVDVFTKEKYGGNQLAVFVDYENLLSDEDMLQITRELKFPEVTFVKKNYDNQSFGVRIFTPEYEVPFAGHPTLGTVFIISKYLIKKPQKIITLRLKHANINVSVDAIENIDNAKFVMQQAQPEFLGNYNHKEIAKGLDINPNFIDNSKPIEEVSTGLPYIIIPMVNLEAISRLNLNYNTMVNFLIANKKHKTNSITGLNTSLFFVTDATYETSSTYNTRMFCIENEQLIEDAATGSANGCLLAYLLKHESKTIKATVEQGFQMNRKSYVYLDGTIKDNIFNLKIGGNVVDISKGKWKI